jgi:hypothetical protein
MNVFLWAINPLKRKEMKRRVEHGKSLKCKLGDENHFKIILAIYLYQYIEFLIFYGFDEEAINNFCKYLIDSLNSKECFACCFEEFLEITKKHSEAIK